MADTKSKEEPAVAEPAEAPTAPAPDSGKPEPTAAQWEERRKALLAKVPASDKMPKSIYGKLASLMGLIPPVEKAGRNDFHKYNYARESDLVEAVRPLLSAYGIFFWWTILEEERRGRKKSNTDEMTDAETLTVLKISFQFIDGATGEKTEPQVVYGYGDDPIDKGLYKAMTGAIKYALMKTFLIATGDDPEGDAAADRRGAAHEASSRVDVRRGAPSQQRPAQRPAAQQQGETTQQAETRQPGPGGRQAASSVPQTQVLGNLMRQLGVRSVDDAAALFKKVGLETFEYDPTATPTVKAAALKKFTEGLQGQEIGKLIHDCRKLVEELAGGAKAEEAAEKAAEEAVEEEAGEPVEAPDMDAGDAV